MDQKVREAICKKISEEPFAKTLGIKLIELGAGYAKTKMAFVKNMENMCGMMHGGAIVSLMDVAFEAASNSHGTIAVALSMNISFMSAPSKESVLVAEAKEVSRTKRTAHYEIKAYDENEKLIASSQAMVFRKDEALPFV
jgi:acyl-CoA thioesterase